jgi:ammonium transporter, Amt family
LFFGGGLTLLVNQFIAVVATFTFSFVASLGIGKVIDKTIGLRISEDDEFTGMDQTLHAESAYQPHVS